MARAGLAVSISLLASAGCIDVPFSEGRDQALELLYRCDPRGGYPARYRAVALRHGLEFRERRMSEDMQLADAQRGGSEFLFQMIGRDVKISLWVRPGTEASAEESRIFAEMTALFADCEATSVPRRRGGP